MEVDLAVIEARTRKSTGMELERLRHVTTGFCRASGT